MFATLGRRTPQNAILTSGEIPGSRDGEIGRRSGLKIRRSEGTVGVRFPLPAPTNPLRILSTTGLAPFQIHCRLERGLSSESLPWLLKNIYRASCQQSYGRQGNERLNHHE